MEQKFITPKEAIGLLNDEEQIHTFKNHNKTLVSTNHNRENLIGILEANPDKIQISSKQYRKMQYGLTIEDSGYLFIKTNEEKLNAFDPPED